MLSVTTYTNTHMVVYVVSDNIHQHAHVVYVVSDNIHHHAHVVYVVTDNIHQHVCVGVCCQ